VRLKGCSVFPCSQCGQRQNNCIVHSPHNRTIKTFPPSGQDRFSIRLQAKPCYFVARAVPAAKPLLPLRHSINAHTNHYQLRSRYSHYDPRHTQNLITLVARAVPRSQTLLPSRRGIHVVGCIHSEEWCYGSLSSEADLYVQGSRRFAIIDNAHVKKVIRLEWRVAICLRR